MNPLEQQKIEPAMDGSRTDTEPAAGRPHLPLTTYAVEFTGADRNGALANSFSFHGKGEITLEGDVLTISGSRRRLFHSAPPETFAFKVESVHNVLVDGLIVRFDIDEKGDHGNLKVAYIAKSRDEADLIARVLPARQTEQFARDTAEQMDFIHRLDRLGNRSPVTIALVALNVIVFALMAIDGYGLIKVNPQMAIDWGSNFGPLTLHGQWWRLFTCTFIHFGLIHLTLNMLALYSTGQFVERIFGSWHFLLLYVFSGLTGSMASMWWHPLVNSAGASGAIFGVFGALLVFMMDKKNAVPASIMQAHSKSTGLFIAYNLVNGFAHAGIDNGAHLGGLVGGMLIGWMLARPLQVEARAKLLTRQFVTVCIGAVLILLAFGYFVLHPNEQAKQETDFVALELDLRDEENVIAERRHIQERAQNKQISAVQFADEIDNKVIPRYQKFLDSVNAVQLDSDSKYKPVQMALMDYLVAKLSAFHLIAQALRTNDQSLTTQIEDSNRAAEEAKEKLKTLTPQ